MNSERIVGAILLSGGIVAYLKYGTPPENVYFLRVYIYLVSYDLRVVFVAFFALFFFPDYILKAVKNAFALVMATGLVLKGYSGTLMPMFSKKKKGPDSKKQDNKSNSQSTSKAKPEQNIEMQEIKQKGK